MKTHLNSSTYELILLEEAAGIIVSDDEAGIQVPLDPVISVKQSKDLIITGFII